MSAFSHPLATVAVGFCAPMSGLVPSLGKLLRYIGQRHFELYDAGAKLAAHRYGKIFIFGFSRMNEIFTFGTPNTIYAHIGSSSLPGSQPMTLA
jgi:hypothetical protein